MPLHTSIRIEELERDLHSLSTESDVETTPTTRSFTSTMATSTDHSSNVNNPVKEPKLTSNKSRDYPDPPPERIGRFRYSLFTIFTYVGLGNCVFFCCLPLLAFENIFRAMGYRTPLSFLCAASHVSTATFCLCPCILCKVRRKFRKKRNIRGNAILDLILSLLLCFCVATQLLTEARAVIIEKKRGLNKPEKK